MQPINNFQAEKQNLVNKIKPNLFFPFVLSPVSHAHRGPHVEVLYSVLQTRVASVEWLPPSAQLCGSVQKHFSQHGNPRWQLGTVCKEAAHSTAVQDGAGGRVQGLPSLALPSGALCSRHWVGQKVRSVKEYLFNNGLG